jgi:hypothetical protein
MLDSTEVTARADPRRLNEVRDALQTYLGRLGSA